MIPSYGNRRTPGTPISFSVLSWDIMLLYRHIMMSVNPRPRMIVTIMQLVPTLRAHIIALVTMGSMEMGLCVMVGSQNLYMLVEFKCF